MHTLIKTFALLLAGASLNVTAFAASAIRITDAYSHPTAAPGVPGVGFMALSNAGKTDDRLLSATSPAAGRIEIHHSRVEAGVMKMRAVLQGVALPAGKAVAFAPGGLHLMLFDLRAPLVDGARLPVTLTFEQAGSVKTELLVRPRAAPPPQPADDQDHSKHHH